MDTTSETSYVITVVNGELVRQPVGKVKIGAYDEVDDIAPLVFE